MNKNTNHIPADLSPTGNGNLRQALPFVPVARRWGMSLILFVLAAGLGLAGVLLSLIQPAAARAVPAQNAPAPAASIVLGGPTGLSPAFTTPCASFWHQYTNNLGAFAYLTLNVNDPSKRFNSAEWVTNLPEIAVYRVEAYIPPHAPLFWDCETDYTTLGDTLSAVYEISALDRTITVTVNQANKPGQWVSLGDYLFAAGSGAKVRITDQTSEPNYQRTVSVSALRFTKVAPGYRNIFPQGLSDSFALRGVYMKSGQVQDRFGNALGRVDMEEPITLAINGYNDAPLVRPADTTWGFDGPCDFADINLLEVRQTKSGSWMETLKASTPPCLGTYTMTLAVAFEERKVTLTKPVTVDPGTRMGLMQQQGFDKCEITSLANMQAWWNDSPYYAANLYIGGMNRSCRNAGLTRDWVKTVQAQGWSLIPTWVGRQAPCMSRDLDKFSTDPATAYAEGKAEALEAAAIASGLGLFEARTQKSIIYLDIEGYRYSPYYTADCRTATSSFVSGWVDGMHTSGLQAGVYGGTCSSFMADWAALPTPPDGVWGAYWYNDPVHRPGETVWGWACVSDNIWANQQRIYQYAGDHPETWGGATLGGIDSNAIEAILPAPRVIPTPAPTGDPGLAVDSIPAAPVNVYGVALSDFQPLSAGQGWLVSGGALLKTLDGGQTWQAQALPELNTVDGSLPSVAADLAFDAGVELRWEMATGGPDLRLALAGTDRPAYADLLTLKGTALSAGADLPGGAASLRAAPDGTLWLHTSEGDCTGVKGTANFACSMVYSLMESRDGGVTWTAVRMP